jgi:hypothetical protein
MFKNSEAGFRDIETTSTSDLAKRHFVGRADKFSSASGEEFLVATTETANPG